MNLENLNLVELNAQEVQEVDGGFLPLIAIYIMWGAMGVMSGATVAAYLGYKNNH